MRVANVLKRFAEGGDLRRRAVREIAFDLPKRHLDRLKEIRAVLGRAPTTPEPDLERGYREGVLDMLAGYEAAIAGQTELEAELEPTVLSRAHWAPIIHALVANPQRPSDLATILRVDPATISRALTGLGAAGVVEELPSELNGRMRLYRLTLRGEALAERFEMSGPVPIGPMARAAARFFADLATRRRITRAELVEQVQAMARLRAGQVQDIVKSFIDAAREFSLAFERDGLLIASEMTAQNRLARELDLAADDEVTRMISELKEQIPDDCTVFVRCAKLRDSWNRVLTLHFASYPAARTIDTQDVLTENSLPRPKGRFVLIYDNETLLKSDLHDRNSVVALHEHATVKVCFGSDLPRPVPDGWTSLAVPGVN